MNKVLSGLLSCAILLLTVVVPGAITYDEYDYERPSEMFKFINEERAEAGLPAYKYNKELENIARIRAVEITSVYDDVRPNGSMFWTLLDDKGISYTSCEENIGMGCISAAHMLNIWMLYEACEDNVLSTKYTDMGAGMVKDDDGAKYWVVVFCENPSCDSSDTNISISTPTPKPTMRPSFDDIPDFGSDDVPIGTMIPLPTSEPSEKPDKVPGYDLPSIEGVFTDVKEESWYYNAVNYVYSHGLMVGTGENVFGSNTPLTRGMLVTTLYRMEDSPAIDNCSPFTDVKEGVWYNKPVQWAYKNGITSGISKTEFGPNNKITREQLVTIIYRYAQIKGLDTSKKNDLRGFNDFNSISSWAVEAMSWANAQGLVNGVGNNTMSPKSSATRAQVATILYKYCELNK